MRKWYMQLHEANRALINQHQIRCNTNENIAESMKAVNQIIQKGARLRGELYITLHAHSLTYFSIMHNFVSFSWKA